MSTLAVSASTAAVSLYYREGSSDKVYHAQITPKGSDLYIVEFQYGRRGSTLQTGVKTDAPLPLDQARKVFEKLVREKKAMGYTEGEQGTPYAGGELANRRFVYTPQLLNSVDESVLPDYLRSPDWLMQEKMDGVRLIVESCGNVVTAGNRRGLAVAISTAIPEAVLALGHDCVLDGEAIGDVYWPFDLLSFDGSDITRRSATYRLQLLMAILKARPSKAIGRVAVAFVERDKRALLETIRAERGEGVVFKNAHAPYTPGRPGSGGDALKHKFKASATCAVLSHNPGKRSVQIAASHDASPSSTFQRFVEIGNVTIPGSAPLPPVGSLIEVEYLYAYAAGALFQPVYKGPRFDKHSPDVYASLKFKPEYSGDGE
ncbi:ATP-dependent DNA ligase (plasmid) [Acidisarcina polymorpha]|uniref:ATP-dependent DNA ligase n=1 Tax=Acidisarcina polymorpha TaxID=2211140 RepID=A0A2Z5GBG8_9BACT|nr:WGR domain-containing protein [Acidisarcina polymorpha]AXC16381.1 ATP-dependent DNA ligase [Acidisarcina polymorpha]